jgi:hypothetical protein
MCIDVNLTFLRRITKHDHQWNWTDWIWQHSTCSLLCNHHIPMKQDHRPNSNTPKHWLWALNNIILPPTPRGLPSGSFLHVSPPKPCMEFPSPLYIPQGPTHFFLIQSKPMHLNRSNSSEAVRIYLTTQADYFLLEQEKVCWRAIPKWAQ